MAGCLRELGVAGDEPRLERLRRLIHGSGDVSEISVPAGDSTSLPGWDAELTSDHGNGWVPKGKSFWEMSADAGVTAKANRDYKKRTAGTSEEVRRKSVYVALTARKWPQKSKWLAEKRAISNWAAVRAYDADDLEQWFEQTPAVKLYFGDELGITGHGVEDVERYWITWVEQCTPNITPDAFLARRENAKRKLIEGLQDRLETGNREPFTIRADSVEEAAAFAVLALLDIPGLRSKSIALTAPSGWRFVEKNNSIQIVVVVRPEFAQMPTWRRGTVVVVPYATGDMEVRSGSGKSSGADIKLERPNISDFADALVSIGIEEAEAGRLSASTGRSWSVLRRRRAINPAIRRPPWLEAPQTLALTTLCLIGSWLGTNPNDREIVAKLAGRSYDELERDLRELARQDDAPVLEIGDVWRAKSPLELLDLFGERFTRAELDRFVQIATCILTAPDPQLELPDDERYAAQIHGKVRPQSGALIRAMCDTLIKLAVWGPITSTDMAASIPGFVRMLLSEADSTRWLSLADILPDLAEAAPDVFLGAIEISLMRPDTPVTRLLTETGGTGLTSRCWHSGLLWALERIAWSPAMLTRVVLILARLSKVTIKGNWGNSPAQSLLNLFRSWLPQTAASLDQRIKTLDTLISKEPIIAFNLLDHIVHVGADTATPAARPEWRDDDAGAGRGVPYGEQQSMLLAAADRLVDAAEGNPEFVARLIQKISIFETDRRTRVLSLVESFCAADVVDEHKEIIREAIRESLHRTYNFGDDDQDIEQREGMYRRLVPSSLILQHRWLFSNGWPSPPWRTRDEEYGKQLDSIRSARCEALQQIYAESSFHGVEQMAGECANQNFVGAALAQLPLSNDDLSDWIFSIGGNFEADTRYIGTIGGLLRAADAERSAIIVEAVLAKASAMSWAPERTANFLRLAHDTRRTWDIAARCGRAVEEAYWARCRPAFLMKDNRGDFQFVLKQLMSVGRVRSALEVCKYDLAQIDANLLTDTLERYLVGEEPNGPLIDAYRLCLAVDSLEGTQSVSRDRLIRLEFGLCRLLGYEGEHHAATLYDELTSNPNLFVEMICLAFKRSDGIEEPASEATETAAKIAWDVLRGCRRQFAAGVDGLISPTAFESFIDEARRLCNEASRLDVCDSQIGAILAYAPSDEAGVWPCQPVRDLLDRPELERMRMSFLSGVLNRRGVTSRDLYEGGLQERELADTYRSYGENLQHTHVYLAAAMRQLADRYEVDASREDSGAQLRREGHY